MTRFSLTGAEWPDSVEADGVRYPVRAGHRNVLNILRMLGDPEVADRDRERLLRRMFYAEAAPMDALTPFENFVRCGREPGEPGGARDFDYEQDAAEIYSAFLQTYGIDLMDTELHWHRFSALLEGLFFSENALSDKVRARHLDDSKAQRDHALDRRKRAVRLTEAVSRTDAALDKQIRERLTKGQPIDDLIGRAKYAGRET